MIVLTSRDGYDTGYWRRGVCVGGEMLSRA